MDVNLIIYHENMAVLELEMEDYPRGYIATLVGSLYDLHRAIGRRFGYYIAITEEQRPQEEEKGE